MQENNGNTLIRRGSLSSGTLLAAVLLVGWCAVTAQVLLLREVLVVFYGNELCVGVTFATWLLGVALGATVGGKLSDRLSRQILLFCCILLCMAFALPTIICLTRFLRSILDVPAGQYIPLTSLFTSCLLLVTPFSFLIGISFPLACKLVARQQFTPQTASRTEREETAGVIGRVYVLEAVGSIIGGGVFTFVLVGRFAPLEVVALINVLIGIIVFLIALRSGSVVSRRVLGAVGIALLVISTYLFFSGMSQEMDAAMARVRWRSFTSDMPLVVSKESRYENLSIGGNPDQYNVYGNGQHMMSFPDEYQHAGFAHFTMVQHPNPKRVLMISGGVSGAMRHMLMHGVEHIDYVELDPEVIELVKPYLPDEDRAVLEDDRVSVHYVDGRYFVQHRSEEDTKYDMVVVNVPDPSTALVNRFYTLDFFREAKAVLADDGVLAVSITSGINYMGAEVGNYTGSVYRTLHEAFSYVLVTPGSTNFYFATDGESVVTSDIEVLTERYRNRHIVTEFFDPLLFQTLLPPEQVARVEKDLAGMKNLRLNTDTRPVAYFFNFMLWRRFTDAGSPGADFQRWINIGLRWFLAPIVLLLVLRLIYVAATRRRVDRHQRFNALVAIATTGFTGMALEIILIFAYQNIYGYVYERIGLIVALFMAGAALGGYVMTRAVKRRVRLWLWPLLIFESAIVLYALAIPLVISGFSGAAYGSLVANSEYVFMLLFVIAGVLAGVEFPVAGRLHLECSGRVGGTSGAVDGADHAGAFLGSLLTGVVFVPLLGTTSACLIIAAINAASVVLLFALIIQRRICRSQS